MKILIIGSEGSMGKRYQAILKYLETEFCLFDKVSATKPLVECLDGYWGYIVATPTDTHYEILKLLAPLGKPVLCEKPVTKNQDELIELMDLFDKHKSPFKMMMQYRVLAEVEDNDLSYYRYFRHGNDGLYWDCMQIIALANGDVELSENTPVWKCQINGVPIDLNQMDLAYVQFVSGWLKKPYQRTSEIIHFHDKVHKYIEERNHG